ncbi:MAG: DUF2079 domain-containing protein, partial [Anaerolineae bacterium]|nr:DUF2079 domain-containing protein [Anaerolineae bacterium]
MNVFIEFALTLLLGFTASGIVYLAHGALGARAFRLSARTTDRIAIALVIVYSIVFSAMTVLRYLSFNIGYLDHVNSWDLAQYDQIIWNSLHGRLFENSFFPDAPNFMGKSFTPILLAFVPLYALWASPIVLLIVQTVALALGALPIYWTARVRIGRGLALTLTLAYLLSPALQNTNVAEFHEVALVTPFLLYTTFFLLRRHYAGFLIGLGLTLLIKEEIALITVMFGLYIFLFQRQRGLGLGVTLFGVVWTVAVLQYVIPYFRTGIWGGTFYYFEGGTIAGGGARYSYLGKNIPEIITTILTRPDIIAAEVLMPSKIAYVLHLLVPLALLPLIGFEMSALSLPTFGYTLLSRYAHQHSLAAAYHAPILPFLFVGAIIGLERVLKWQAARASLCAHALAALLLVTSVSSYWLEAPGPFARKFQPWRYTLNEHTALGHRALEHIPKHEGIVAAQNELLAYVSQRRFVYEVPVKDYRQFDYLFADRTRGWYRVHESFWEPYLASGYFDILFDEDGWVVAKRRTPTTPVGISFDGKMTLLAYTLIPESDWRGGETLRPIVAWRADAPMHERYIVSVCLEDRQGHVWKCDTREPQDGNLPTNRWITGQIVQDQYWIHIDHFVPTGEYLLVVRVYTPSHDALVARDETGKPLDEHVTLLSLPIQKSQASVTASQINIEQRLMIDFGELRL